MWLAPEGRYVLLTSEHLTRVGVHTVKESRSESLAGCGKVTELYIKTVSTRVCGYSCERSRMPN